MNKKEKELLNNILDKDVNSSSAFNLRINGELVNRKSTENVKIETKKDKPGINIYVKENTKAEEISIPVIITEDALNDMVYNDFYIGENASVKVFAGCGIHNDCEETSEHSGVHTFHLEKNAKVNYIEKHYGCGEFSNNKTINTLTVIDLKENSELNIETLQISGVDNAIRETNATLLDNSKLIINEKIMTGFNEQAKTKFNVKMDGLNSSLNISSKSIAKDSSHQEFFSTVIGNNECFAHIECDAILMDNATVSSTPEITANDTNASLIHEASIGKIANEQLIKLMTLGLSKEEAEQEIIKGFLN